MRIARAETTAYAIPFRRPFRVAGALVRERRGVLVRLHADDGRVGLGEVAPHPSTGSASTRADWRQLVGQAVPRLLAGTARPADLIEGLNLDTGDRAMRAGIEAAWFDLAAQEANVGLAELLAGMLGTPGAARAKVPVNATLDATDAHEAADAARAFVAAGFRCIKVKVGAGDDDRRLAAIRAAVGDDVQLRVDANAAWTVDEAVAALARLSAHRLEYVEQPVAGIADLARVRRAVDVPIAADESVTDAASVEEIAAAGAADLIVVKPSRLGLVTSVEIVRAAAGHGLGVVVTSVLETSVGIAAALHLAAALPGTARPCGLATASLLAGDLVAEELAPAGGFLDRPDGIGLGVHVDERKLAAWRTGENG